MGKYRGWHISADSLSEDKFGYALMTGAYRLGTERKKDKLIEKMMKLNPRVQYSLLFLFLPAKT